MTTMTTGSMPEPIARWHEVVRTSDRAALDAILADECTFRSPAVHTPQAGKAVTTAYLEAAMVVLGPHLTYHREWYAEDSAVLEFTTKLQDTEVHGVDMIAWDETGRITDFCVMVRPHRALNVLIEKMAAELFKEG